MLTPLSSIEDVETERRRIVLEWLGKKYLAAVCDALKLPVSDRRRYESFIGAIEQAQVPMREILEPLNRDALKRLCLFLKIDSIGREKILLIDRILQELTLQQKTPTDYSPKRATTSSEEMVRPPGVTGNKNTSTVSTKKAPVSGSSKTHVRKTLFISYSHHDRPWLEMLRPHLRPLERQGTVEIWDDTRIQAGMKWKDQINAAITRARVAVLLVSSHFLASDFIVSNELPPLLDSAERDGLTVLPLVVSPCRFTKTPSISRYQAVNDPRSTLQDLSDAERNWRLVELTDRIEQCLSDD